MITLFHGSDSAKSRNAYIDLKEGAKEAAVLDGKTVTITDLLQALSSGGLFGDSQTIFIENLFSNRKPSKELDEIINGVQQAESDIVLWESKDLTPKQLGVFKKAKVQQFKIPTIVFTFVDSLLPGNGKKLIMLFHELLGQEGPLYALVMLQRQVRILLSLKDNKAAISEVSRLAPWQLGKLKKQAAAFSQDQLIALHTKLYELELGQKTGTLSYPLDQAIDFLLPSI